MNSVRHLLEHKGIEVWFVRPETSVLEAIRQMDQRGVGALLVMVDEKLVGIVSERDYARKVILKGRSSAQTEVQEIMTTHVYYATPEQECRSALAMMNKYAVRHLPVMEGGRCVGVISIGDLVNDIIAEQRDTIEHLEQAVSWSESY